MMKDSLTSLKREEYYSLLLLLIENSVAAICWASRPKIVQLWIVFLLLSRYYTATFWDIIYNRVLHLFLVVVQLNVIIDDVNDNAPVFIEQDIFITVGEGEDLSEVLVQGQLASDIDSGTNGQITYSLLRDEGSTYTHYHHFWWPVTEFHAISPAGVFGIDANTGVITLTNSLDRETTER